MGQLVVFRYLRCNYVFKRPRHVLSCIAAHRPIVYTEELIQCTTVNRFKIITAASNREVWRPQVRGVPSTDMACQVTMHRMVAQALRQRRMEDY